MGRSSVVCFLTMILVVLAACTAPPPSRGALIAEACSAETGVAGSYDYDGSDDVPVVTPLAGNSRLVGGTAEGAAQLNACIRAKAAAGQTDGTVVRANSPQPLPSARPGGTEAYAAQCLFEVTVPSGGGRQAGIDAMNACISRKAAAAENRPASTTSALPDVAGVPQTSTTQTTGTSTTTTFTNGTPPAPAVAASGTAPSRQCNLQMTGGTGYICVAP
jgi:hypothetical protein